MMISRNVNKEEITIYNESHIYKAAAALQLDKGQDHVDQGHYINSDGERVDWVVALDGHGNNSSINSVRNANMAEIMEAENPAQELQNIIDADKTTTGNMKLRSGATFICAKMYENKKTDKVHLDILYAGDSVGVVILNEQHIFTTNPHTLNHSVQMMRLIKKGIVSATDPFTIEQSGFELVNSDTLVSKKGRYIKLHTRCDRSGYMTMAPSNSIGHNGLYGSLDVDTEKFVFKKTDTIRVVLMSDGVSDVVDKKDTIFVEAKSPTDIVNYAHERWKQTWNCIVDYDFSKTILTKFPKNGYDDCCAAMIERKPYMAIVSDAHADAVAESIVVEVLNDLLEDISSNSI